MNPILIAPSILAADFTRLGAEIEACESAGAEWIHVDVMDGHFVPNLTMGPFIVEACRRATRLPLDVHLMIEEPERYIDAFAEAGASHLTIHVETCRNPTDVIRRIKALGCKAGITLNPATPASSIEPFLPQADLVLVMTVNPGYGGQKFMPEVLPKIEEVREALDRIHSPARLEVDGGISAGTLPGVRKAGADTFVAGNFVFKHPLGIAEGIRSLRGSAAL